MHQLRIFTHQLQVWYIDPANQGTIRDRQRRSRPRAPASRCPKTHRFCRPSQLAWPVTWPAETVMYDTGTASLHCQPDHDGDAGATALRPFWSSIVRGLRCRCPACGQGRLFGRFLKPVENCQVCNESYIAQRADDFPPYLVILLLGHILIPAILLLDHTLAPPLWAYMTFGSVFVAMLAAAMLQPAKGAVIAFQWVFRMQGFGATDSRTTSETG